MILKFEDFLNESNVQFFAKTALQAIDFFRKELKIKSEVEIKNGTIKGNQGHTSPAVNGKYSIHLNMNNTTLVSMLRTIAHELVHVKQMESGRLVHNDNNIIFDGTELDMKDYTEKHDEYPFEMEAHDQQRQLADKFLTKYKIEKNPFFEK